MIKRELILVGGSFNPITNAHINMGLEAKKMFPCADLIFVPNNLNEASKWKDINKDDIFYKNRDTVFVNTMVANGFKYSFFERDCKNPSTYENIEYFKSLGYTDIYVCIGDDKLDQMYLWEDIGNVLNDCHVRFILFKRDGIELKGLLKWYSSKFIEAGSLLKYWCISSTIVRNIILDGKIDTIKEYIPKEVYEFYRGDNK